MKIAVRDKTDDELFDMLLSSIHNEVAALDGDEAKKNKYIELVKSTEEMYTKLKTKFPD